MVQERICPHTSLCTFGKEFHNRLSYSAPHINGEIWGERIGRRCNTLIDISPNICPRIKRLLSPRVETDSASCTFLFGEYPRSHIIVIHLQNGVILIPERIIRSFIANFGKVFMRRFTTRAPRGVCVTTKEKRIAKPIYKIIFRR